MFNSRRDNPVAFEGAEETGDPPTIETLTMPLVDRGLTNGANEAQERNQQD
jgi:hypothetical protein